MIQRIRATVAAEVDAFKQPIKTGSTVVDMPPGDFAPNAQRTTHEVGRAADIEQPAVYFWGAFPDVLPTDQLSVNGAIYDVDGIPERWGEDSTTGPRGTVVFLKAVIG